MLLVAGWIVFWAGAINPLAYRLWGQGASLREFLAIVAAEPMGWRAIAGSFGLGALSTSAGFLVLGTALRARGERLWSELGRTALTLGLAAWFASLGFRATATVAAAGALADTGAMPAWYPPLGQWAGSLFAIYMVLVYLAIAAYGRALLAVGWAPRWAKVLLVFGLGAAAGFAAGVPVFNPPLMVHPIPGLFGVALLLRGRRA